MEQVLYSRNLNRSRRQRAFGNQAWRRGSLKTPRTHAEWGRERTDRERGRGDGVPCREIRRWFVGAGKGAKGWPQRETALVVGKDGTSRVVGYGEYRSAVAWWPRRWPRLGSAARFCRLRVG